MQAPRCPKCGRKMILRTARQGRYAGRQFWGCSGYPNCKGIVNIDPAESENNKKTEDRQQANTYISHEEPNQSTSRKIWIGIRITLGWIIAIVAVIAGIWMTIDEYTGVSFGPRWGGGAVIFTGLAIAAGITGNETIRRKKRR